MKPTAAPQTGSMDCDVTIVMPCLDEKQTLGRCIAMASEALATLSEQDGLSGEVLIADNGSTDGSQEIARQQGARVVDCEERGYGSALRCGVRAARGRFVVMGDADASYDFREAVPMVRKLVEGYELCMGSRLEGTILPGAMPWKNRHIGNPALTGILNLLFRSGLSDAHCGLRAFSKEAFERIDPTSTGMEFASEIVIKAALLDLRRTEVPITLHPDGRDRPPHLRPWRDGWRHLRYLVMLSPLWLYFLPSALLLGCGALLSALLLPYPSGSMVYLGPLEFGDHWMPLAGGLLTIGHQGLLLGLAATLYGIVRGYRRVSGTMRWIARLGQLEVMLVIGVLAFAAGLGLLIYVVAIWSAKDFRDLSRIREMVAATTLMVIGLQSFFGGFLLSVVGGNEAQLSRAIARGPGRGATEG